MLPWLPCAKVKVVERGGVMKGGKEGGVRKGGRKGEGRGSGKGVMHVVRKGGQAIALL